VTAALRRVWLAAVLVACAAVAGCPDQSTAAKQAAAGELTQVAVPAGWSPTSETFEKGADTLWNMERNYVSSDPQAKFVDELKGPVAAAGWGQPKCSAEGDSCTYNRNGHVLWIIQQQEGPKAACPSSMGTCSVGTMRLEL
jgi:hypothetical protein